MTVRTSEQRDESCHCGQLAVLSNNESASGSDPLCLDLGHGLKGV